MKALSGIACLLLIQCTPRAPTVAVRDARTRAPAVAIRAVTAVDVMDGSLRGKQTVLVAGNRITAVGPADRVRIPVIQLHRRADLDRLLAEVEALNHKVEKRGKK